MTMEYTETTKPLLCTNSVFSSRNNVFSNNDINFFPLQIKIKKYRHFVTNNLRRIGWKVIKLDTKDEDLLLVAISRWCQGRFDPSSIFDRTSSSFFKTTVIYFYKNSLIKSKVFDEHIASSKIFAFIYVLLLKLYLRKLQNIPQHNFNTSFNSELFSQSPESLPSLKRFKSFDWRSVTFSVNEWYSNIYRRKSSENSPIPNSKT